MKNTYLTTLFLSLFLLSFSGSMAQSSLMSEAREFVVDDNFEYNNYNWNLTDNNEKTTTIRNGEYKYYAKVDKIQYLTIPVYLDYSRDFIIETRVAYKRGVAGYGLVLGRENDKNTWRFIVTDRDGQYFIRKVVRGVKTVVQPWKGSDAIHQNHEMNTYSVIKRGGSLYFYANGTLLKTTDYVPFSGNQFGFFCAGMSTIRAEYFKVAYLDGQTVQNQQQYEYNNQNNQNNQYTNQNEQDYNQNDDNAAPTIVVREPLLERGFKAVKQQTLRVAGFAKTKAGLNEVTVNGVVAYLGQDGYFSVEVPVKYGDNTITIKATDIRYKTSTKTFSINRQ